MLLLSRVFENSTDINDQSVKLFPVRVDILIRCIPFLALRSSKKFGKWQDANYGTNTVKGFSMTSKLASFSLFFI